MVAEGAISTGFTAVGLGEEPLQRKIHSKWKVDVRKDREVKMCQDSLILPLGAMVVNHNID